MFDFPTTPAVDDIYTPLPGISYQWDGVVWAYATTSTPIVIEQLIPGYLLAGGADRELRVTGIGFMQSSVIYLDGVATTNTVFVSTEEVRTLMAASAETLARPVAVTVRNGTVESNALVFNYVLTPTLVSMAPPSISVSGAPLDVTLTGTNFVSGSIGYLNYQALPTVYVSATQLTVTVSPNMGTPGDQLYMQVYTGQVITSNQLLFAFTA
jgi:hypothetical protein